MTFFRHPLQGGDELGKTLYLSGAALLVCFFLFRRCTVFRWIVLILGALFLLFALARTVAGHPSQNTLLNKRFIRGVTSIRKALKRLFCRRSCDDEVPVSPASQEPDPASPEDNPPVSDTPKDESPEEPPSPRPGMTGTYAALHPGKAHTVLPPAGSLKNYQFFPCPQCSNLLRVPRGKGSLQVTCTKCGNRFEVRS